MSRTDSAAADAGNRRPAAQPQAVPARGIARAAAFESFDKERLLRFDAQALRGGRQRRPLERRATACRCSALIQLSVGTGDVISMTTRSGDGGNRFLSQSAASAKVSDWLDAAARAAAATFASNRAIACGLFVRSRARPASLNCGASHSCGSNVSVRCARRRLA